MSFLKYLNNLVEMPDINRNCLETGNDQTNYHASSIFTMGLTFFDIFHVKIGWTWIVSYLIKISIRDYEINILGNASNKRCFRRGISSLVKNGQNHHLKNPISETRFTKWSSLLFPLLPFSCSSHRQWQNPFLKRTLPFAQRQLSIVSLQWIFRFMHLFNTEFRRRRSMCELIIPCEVPVKLYMILTVVGSSLGFAMQVSAFRLNDPPIDRCYFFRPRRMEVLWTYFPGKWWNVGLSLFYTAYGLGFWYLLRCFKGTTGPCPLWIQIVISYFVLVISYRKIQVSDHPLFQPKFLPLLLKICLNLNNYT